MVDAKKKFDDILRNTVSIWQSRDHVKGIWVYGSFASGTVTMNSDLDISVVWDDKEAPVQLLSDHGGVRVDMTFLTPEQMEAALSGREQDPIKVCEVVGRLRNAMVVLDRDGSLRNLQKEADAYRWSPDAIGCVKARALGALDKATKFAAKDDTVSAVYEIRNGLFDLARVIVMKSNQFKIIRPSEVLGELRLLDPIAYQLFLRTFKLKGLEEKGLIAVLSDIRHWLDIGEERFADSKHAAASTEMLSQAQREYHGSLALTMNGEYELAVFEMRRSIHSLGLALLTLDGMTEPGDLSVVEELREREPAFYEEILVKYGAFDFQPKGVERSIGEARFIAKRL